MKSKCPKCTNPDYQGKHVATKARPSMATLERMVTDQITPRATDGCKVEPDGRCVHGHHSWLLVLRIL